MKRFYIEYVETVRHSAIILAESQDEALAIAEVQLKESDERFNEYSDEFRFKTIYEESETGYNLPVFDKNGYVGKDY